jgi:hypothetical protein
VDYLEDGLGPEQRKLWRLHIEKCSECRVWAISEDPTLLLQRPATVEVGNSERVDRCVDSVTAMIRQDTLHRRLKRRPQLRLAVAAAALVVMLSATWWFTGVGSQEGTFTEDLPAPERQPVLGPEVEFDMNGDGMRIYQLADDEDTAVWFVVNPELES